MAYLTMFVGLSKFIQLLTIYLSQLTIRHNCIVDVGGLKFHAGIILKFSEVEEIRKFHASHQSQVVAYCEKAKSRMNVITRTVGKN